MPLKWKRIAEGEDTGNAKDDLSSIEIKPDDIKDAIKPHLDSMQTEINKSLDDRFKPMNEFFAAQKREKDEAARKKAADDNKIDDTDYITDPEGTLNKRLEPILKSQAAMAAVIVKKETLGDLDYYSSDSDFRRKVDELISAQPLQNQSNSAIIMNAYKSVYFDMRKEIEEGKIKSKLSAASSGTGGTGGHSGDRKDVDDTITMSAEEKEYARKMGISEADWMKSKKELEYV
jgi:hypothetical protein